MRLAWFACFQLLAIRFVLLLVLCCLLCFVDWFVGVLSWQIPPLGQLAPQWLENLLHKIYPTRAISQLLKPCFKGDQISSKIFKNAYLEGILDSQMVLHRRFTSKSFLFGSNG